MKKESRHSSIKSLNAADQSSVLLLKGAAPEGFSEPVEESRAEVTDLPWREFK